jgi:8-oxo-dGTP pyrophosphatase MutT (NUDIX family)
MAEQLFQIGVKGLIRRADGKVLLLKIRAWRDKPTYWDLPGGRMEPGETFVQTLKRELKEEIGVNYEGDPKQIGTVLSNITIPVGDEQIPLVLLPYEVELPEGIEIRLSVGDPEEAYDWFSVKDAAEKLTVKYTQDFCDMVAAL